MIDQITTDGKEATDELPSHPFIWTKTPDEVLDRIDRKRKHVSPTRH